jgi:hypothetical protein
MGLLNRNGRKPSGRQRGKMRRRLRDIADERSQRLRDLGGLALEMHKRERFEPELLSRKAAEIAALDEEAKLLRRCLDEGLTLGQLEELPSEGSGLGAAPKSQPQ